MVQDPKKRVSAFAVQKSMQVDSLLSDDVIVTPQQARQDTPNYNNFRPTTPMTPLTTHWSTYSLYSQVVDGWYRIPVIFQLN